MLPALYQHLYPHVVGDQAAFHQLAQKIKLDLGSGREADFNFFKPKLDQHVEKLNLLFYHHGLDQRLVAVPQVYAAP